jgi:hypothetical protein
MIRDSEHPESFDPETLRILCAALDDAWQHLEAGTHLNGSADAARAVLARHIVAMARQGQRDRGRLIEGALARLRL